MCVSRKKNPGADWEDAASTTLALGDYYMYQGNEQRARKTYRDAWEMLSEDEDKLAYRRDALERFRSLREQPIPNLPATGMRRTERSATRRSSRA